MDISTINVISRSHCVFKSFHIRRWRRCCKSWLTNHDSNLIVNHWIFLTRNRGFSTFVSMTLVNILRRTQNNSQLCLQWPKNVILIQSIIFPNPNQDFSCQSLTRTQAPHSHNLTLYTVPKEMERMQHKGALKHQWFAQMSIDSIYSANWVGISLGFFFTYCALCFLHSKLLSLFPIPFHSTVWYFNWIMSWRQFVWQRTKF